MICNDQINDCFEQKTEKVVEMFMMKENFYDIETGLYSSVIISRSLFECFNSDQGDHDWFHRIDFFPALFTQLANSTSNPMAASTQQHLEYVSSIP
jgi:hypothetical protein